MLYTPWRIENTDLLGEYESYEVHFRAREMECRENECKYVSNMELIHLAIAENNRHGPPEHAWPGIAPEVEHINANDREAGSEVLQNLEQEDLEANCDIIKGNHFK